MVAFSDLDTAARGWLGVPYVFGGTSRSGVDCSGLMKAIFGAVGVNLPRTTFDQVKVGQAVPKDQIRPGDLVFSSWDGTPHSHVAMAVAPNRVIVAPHSGTSVQYQDLNPTYLTHVDAVRRVPGVAGSGGGGAVLTSATGFGIPSPGDLVGAVQDAAGALHDMAGGVAEAGKFADMLMKLALPSTMLRVVTGLLGVGFVVVGIGFLAKEIREHG